MTAQVSPDKVEFDGVDCVPGEVVPGTFAVYEGVFSLMSDVELPPAAPDGRIWLTTAQAAEVAHVAPCTITKWKNDHLITPHPASHPRHPMYDREEVLDAERGQRRKAIDGGHAYWAQRRPGLRRSKGQVA